MTDPSLRRVLTSETLGPYSRFRLESFATRFGGVEWFVWDAEQGAKPAIVMQGAETACRAFIAKAVA